MTVYTVLTAGGVTVNRFYDKKFSTSPWLSPSSNSRPGVKIKAFPQFQFFFFKRTSKVKFNSDDRIHVCRNLKMIS
jgi:hypothetical protein